MIKGSKIFKVTVSNGKIDPKEFNQYDDFNSETTYGTLNQFKEKAKAYYRWMLMSMNLNKGLEVLSNVKSTATSISVPDTVEFILTYTQPDGLWLRDENDNIIDDNIQLITKIIEDTLNQTYNVILTYFDPSTINEENETSMPHGRTMGEIEVEASTPSVSVEELFEYTQFAN